MTFSTLKAGRDLAAITTLSSGGGNTTFQYPQSGSRPCRVQSTLWFTPYFRLSVPSKRVETLPLKRLIAICPLAGTFSTLKAGRDLAAAAPLKRFSSNMYFQYPQSGSRPCRVQQWSHIEIISSTFSTLKAGRDLAALNQAKPRLTPEQT